MILEVFVGSIVVDLPRIMMQTLFELDDTMCRGVLGQPGRGEACTLQLIGTWQWYPEVKSG